MARLQKEAERQLRCIKQQGLALGKDATLEWQIKNKELADAIKAWFAKDPKLKRVIVVWAP